MEREDFCHLLTDTLLQRKIMMELLAVHLIAIEKNCSLEKLTEFKAESQRVFEILEQGLEKFFPQTDEASRTMFMRNWL